MTTLSLQCSESKHKEDAFELDIYIGTADNPYFLGPASVREIAGQIYRSCGPSGRNTEYLFRLAEATKAIAPPGVADLHLDELEAAVRQLCREGTRPC